MYTALKTGFNQFTPLTSAEALELNGGAVIFLNARINHFAITILEKHKERHWKHIKHKQWQVSALQYVTRNDKADKCICF